MDTFSKVPDDGLYMHQLQERFAAFEDLLSQLPLVLGRHNSHDGGNPAEPLEAAVIQWADDRGIFARSEPETQALKMGAEAGELMDAVAKGNRAGTIDGIGDVMVTLIILARMHDLSAWDCLAEAYAEIKDRKGSMVHGVFVKETGND